ncbi:hypothetical protein MJO28_016654 [Puccinia striiformis f. sp. tritici]|uniref:CBS domain-containing protein n=3 Tax=Puccinia striiformis TaxID=27350 RepID=A0A0L0V788_9BASI|nr:hypothetical protein MJO29_015988 [Puccinia striiformis f. sp. tritici]KAI7935783.1 hypothetical protein MJO28_016654 [Puccinia striiformis f. sp. tritici]KNE95142.1 hypothetical protein PSTG_11510 [Puccinia striiformis f. sp. tritici PST-78]KNE95143.1 hypothetical protein, variant [Puccinia striiformis f. sp. tritici PST-78]POW01346.1 hypothetical protein PSTT_12543 [Puccinia striiformis]
MASAPTSATTTVRTSTPTKLVKPTNAHTQALANLREFLAEKTCYDILPESYRLIVFDNSLGIKRALTALMTNGVVSAPLYDSTSFKFCGMFTLTDVIHLIQYFYLKASPLPFNSGQSSASSATSSPCLRVQHPINDQSQGILPTTPLSSSSSGSKPAELNQSATSSPAEDPYALAAAEVESFPLSRLRDIEQAIEAPPPPTVHVHPDAPLIEACEQLIRTHARRLPLIDVDSVTGKDSILCVLTQYRVLKFIAINAQSDVIRLTQSIGSLGIGSYVSSYQSEPMNHLSDDEHHHDPFHPLATATLETTVFDVVHMFSERGISAVPIVDADGSVIDMYEAVDIVDLVRSDAYRLLDLTIAEAIARRSPEFCGVTVCSAEDSLANILKYIGERRVHRFVIVEDETVIETEVTGIERVRDEDATPLAEASPPKFETDPPDGRSKITRRKKVKDRLVGMISLSDIMKHIVGTKQKSLQGKSIVGLGVNEGKSSSSSGEIISGKPGLIEEVDEENQSVVIDNEEIFDDEDGPT